MKQRIWVRSVLFGFENSGRDTEKLHKTDDRTEYDPPDNTPWRASQQQVGTPADDQHENDRSEKGDPSGISQAASSNGFRQRFRWCCGYRERLLSRRHPGKRVVGKYRNDLAARSFLRLVFDPVAVEKAISHFAIAKGREACLEYRNSLPAACGLRIGTCRRPPANTSRERPPVKDHRPMTAG